MKVLNLRNLREDLTEIRKYVHAVMPQRNEATNIRNRRRTKSDGEEHGTGTIFRGVTPFWMVDLVRLTVLVLFPAITLWLPSLMG